MDATVENPPGAATNSAIPGIRDDITALQRDFAMLTNHLRSGAAQGTSDAVQRTVVQLNDNARRLYGNLAAQGERSAKALGRHVKEQPVMSLLLAFAVGFIGSRLLSR